MEINETRHGAAVVLALQGSLDVVTSPDLETRMMAAIDAGVKHLVFDLSKLDYVSSAGLRVFMMGLKRLQKDGRVRFCALTKPVKQVFDVAGLTLRTTLCATVAEALK